jgi:hypothetical protein
MDTPSPLLGRFVAALEGQSFGRLRVPLADYMAAFLEAEPALATAPDRRTRLEAALADLAASGVIRPSRKLDRSEQPALPSFVILLSRITDPPVGPDVARFPWRPELVWARRLPLRRSEFDALRAIQTFLRDEAAKAPTVPLGERSLQIFGDEKRLDTLRNNRRLFAPGRLDLDLLKARAYAPPFAYRKVGNGPVALVLENIASYRSVLGTLPPDSPVGLVIFGGGMNFGSSVLYLRELIAEGPAQAVRHVRYFGDLDPPGLTIPQAANRTALQNGLPPVRPAPGLWSLLLRHGRPAPWEPVSEEDARSLTAWLPDAAQRTAMDLLVSGKRLAQEAVGTEVLMRCAEWAGSKTLGIDHP